MTSMNVSLPERLRDFVDVRVREGSYGSTRAYVLDLIRRDQDRRRLRADLLQGAGSPVGPMVDTDYFASLREQARGDN